MENKISKKRFIYLFLSFVLFLGCSVLFCVLKGLLLDQFIIVIALNIVFCLLFAVIIIKKRLDKELAEVKYNSYGKIFLAFVICWCLIIAFTYIDNFFVPIMLLAITCACVLDESLSISISLYLACLLCISNEISSYVLYIYILSIILGTLLTKLYLKETAFSKLLLLILAFALNTLIITAFNYFSNFEINLTVFVKALISSLISVGYLSIAAPLFNKSVQQTQENCYDDLISDSYPLVIDIRRYSYVEYLHAYRVSRLSKLCAGAIGCNKELAACGGFYYRLGKLEGEPEIDNAIRVANDHCFPEDVINILSEYGAIMKKPSTKESAIVHMVDAIVTKIELFNQDTMDSKWNQDMVIYQTLNELSNKGYYDEAGITMNQFLIIRNLLVKEDILVS